MMMMIPAASPSMYCGCSTEPVVEPRLSACQNGTAGGAFICRPNLSIMPISCGCHDVVLARGDLVMLANVLKRLASNCLPWSVVICLMAAEMTVPDGGENLGNCISGIVPSNFFYGCSFLLLLRAERFYMTWRLRGTVIVVCNMHNNIYSENWKTAHF